MNQHQLHQSPWLCTTVLLAALGYTACGTEDPDGNGALGGGGGATPLAGQGGTPTGGTDQTPPLGGAGGAPQAGMGPTGGTTPVGGTGGTGGTGGIGGPQCVTATAPDGDLLLHATSASNYMFTSDIAVSTVPVVANSLDLTFDWSALTHDLLNHEIAQIDMISLLVWNLSHEEMERKLNSDELSQADTITGGAIRYLPTAGETSATLRDFEVITGGPVPEEELQHRLNPEQYDPATTTYTLMAHEGTIAGEGVLMLQAFSLSTGEPNQAVPITNDSSSLTFSVDLEALTPFRIPTGTANITLDSTQMTETPWGRAWDPGSIYEMRVSHYNETPAELEEKFLDLERLPTNTWRNDAVFGTSMKLSELSDDSGQPFTGIDGNGTWILALICGTCGNPAPWYLTLLQPCGQ